MKEKILIVLSDSNLVSILSLRLANEGYIVSNAKDGDEALKKMHVELPKVVLIDLVLSGKNGYDVLAEKTLDRLITKIPVIIVSNTGTTVDIKRIPSTPSIHSYVIKTHVDPEEVTKKVDEILGHTYVPPGTKADTPHKKILWVEDDAFLIKILAKKFETVGYTVLRAANGDEVFKTLETARPDIIILDIMLPGINGFEILQKIKMNDKLRSIPVLILSNLNKPEDIEKARVLGVQKFLVKAAVSLNEIVREVDITLKI